MKVGKSTAFLLDFVSDFADGKMDRYDFERDYSGYIIEHFPKMEHESARLARKFADTVDKAYENVQYSNISDDDFRIIMNNAICDFLGVKEPDLF